MDRNILPISGTVRPTSLAVWLTKVTSLNQEYHVIKWKNKNITVCISGTDIRINIASQPKFNHFFSEIIRTAQCWGLNPLCSHILRLSWLKYITILWCYQFLGCGYFSAVVPWKKNPVTPTSHEALRQAVISFPLISANWLWQRTCVSLGTLVLSQTDLKRWACRALTLINEQLLMSSRLKGEISTFRESHTKWAHDMHGPLWMNLSCKQASIANKSHFVPHTTKSR